MTEWLNQTNEQRKVSLEQAAAKAGLPANAIEKDWWVTLTIKGSFYM
jgi:hypothetical protein